ncbi:MAG: glycosyltransferase family 2 protein [Nocardioides sp.]
MSVIVPFYSVERYLAECLDSIVGQSFEDIEVLLVDDGSPDGSRRIADEYAAQDPRLRVVARENGGLGAARNTGVREARGQYLSFVDSDDVLPQDALRRLVASARESGSDIVVGAVERFNSDRRWRPAWVPAVHDTPRTGITIDEHLPLLRNLYTWNKLFRRDFWDVQQLWFREGVAYEDQPIITQLFARAGSIDVLPDVVYLYRSRDDNSSISQQTATLADLRARILAWEVSRDALRPQVSSALFEAWLGTLFTTHFHWYLTNEGTADDTYWSELVRAVRDFTEGAPRSVWDATKPAKRVLIELARQDRRADAQEFVRRDAMNAKKWSSSLRDDGVLLHLPFLGDAGLDEDLFLIRPEQLELVHTVEEFSWVERGDGTVAARLSGWAYVAKVDLSRLAATTQLLLRNQETGEEVRFNVLDRPETAFPPPVDDEWCDYSPGTFGIEVPVADVLGRSGPAAGWLASLQITVGSLSVTRPLNRVRRSSGAGTIPAYRAPDGRRLVPVWSARQPFGLRVESSGAEVRHAAVEGRALVGRLSGGHWSPSDEVKVLLPGQSSEAFAAIGGSGEFRIELPDAPTPESGQPLTWRVRILHADGSTDSLVPPGRFPGSVGPLGPATNRLGELVVTEWGMGAEADEVVADDGMLVIRGRVHGAVTHLNLVAHGPDARVNGPLATATDGRFEAVLDLRHGLMASDGPPLTRCDIHADLRAGDGVPVDVRVRVSPSLGYALPQLLVVGPLQIRVQRGPDARLFLLVRPGPGFTPLLPRAGRDADEARPAKPDDPCQGARG